MNFWDYSPVVAAGQAKARLGNIDYSKRNNRGFISNIDDAHKSIGPCDQATLNLCDHTKTVNGGRILIPGSHTCRVVPELSPG